MTIQEFIQIFNNGNEILDPRDFAMLLEQPTEDEMQ